MPRNENGWVKEHRSIFGSWIFRDGDAYRIFKLLIGWANWRDSATVLKGQQIALTTGQVATSVAEICAWVLYRQYGYRLNLRRSFRLCRLVMTGGAYGRVAFILEGGRDYTVEIGGQIDSITRDGKITWQKNSDAIYFRMRDHE